MHGSLREPVLHVDQLGNVACRAAATRAARSQRREQVPRYFSKSHVSSSRLASRFSVRSNRSIKKEPALEDGGSLR